MIIDFDNNIWDQIVEELTKERFTARIIAKRTGLSMSQIGTRRTRLRKKGIWINESRNGTSPYAKDQILKIEKMLGWISAMKISPTERRLRYINRGHKKRR